MSNAEKKYNIRFYLESENRWLFDGETLPFTSVPQVGLHIDIDRTNVFVVKDVCLAYRNFMEYYNVLVDYDNNNNNISIRNKYWRHSWRTL